MSRPARRKGRRRLMLISITGIAGVVSVVTTAVVLLAPSAPPPGAPELTVFKSPSCQCCARWIAHMRAEGFAVRVNHSHDLKAAQGEHGISSEHAACHTALVAGYVIEGHVPAEDVERLLREHPQARGLSVPQMPVGSPGMEGPNPKPYDVWLLHENQGATVFAHHDPKKR